MDIKVYTKTTCIDILYHFYCKTQTIVSWYNIMFIAVYFIIIVDFIFQKKKDYFKTYKLYIIVEFPYYFYSISFLRTIFASLYREIKWTFPGGQKKIKLFTNEVFFVLVRPKYLCQFQTIIKLCVSCSILNKYDVWDKNNSFKINFLIKSLNV